MKNESNDDFTWFKFWMNRVIRLVDLHYQRIKVLKLYCHTRQQQKTLAASYPVVVEVCKFWSRTGIQVRKKDRCVKKLEKLHYTYRDLQKKSSNIEREQEFSRCLEKPFDIAHCNTQKTFDSGTAIKFRNTCFWGRYWYCYISIYK